MESLTECSCCGPGESPDHGMSVRDFKKGRTMCNSEVCYSWHYVPWASIACMMILLANYWIVKHYATKWLENFLAMRKIHKSILEQQRRMYSEHV